MSLVRFSNQYPSLFDHFLNNDLFNWSNRNYSDTTLPSVNIKEDSEGYEVEVAAPGFGKEDFKIELNNNVLTISSEKQEDNGTKAHEAYRN